jgi:hypothetical protein
MTKPSQEDNKDRIMSAFHQLLVEHQKISSKVVTKEEEAEKAKYQELLDKVRAYTVDSIVNGTAALQLNFGSIVSDLSGQLLDESKKLNALKKAITIEHKNLDQLQRIRIVADALYLLRKEHEEKLAMLEMSIKGQTEKIEKEMAQTRKIWSKEQIEFESKIKEQETSKAKQREKELDEYNYKIERTRQVEMDKYEEEKRLQEFKLQAQNQAKEKAWQEREKYLMDNQAEFEKNQALTATFEGELKQIYTDEKNKASEKADRDAKVKADLIEKEWEAEKQGYELQISALKTSIQHQIERISELTDQLQTASNQAQNLAMRAFQSSN